MLEMLALTAIGFVGSLHCVGMCGPLVLAYSLRLRRPSRGTDSPKAFLWKKGLSHHLAFHLGRILTYGFLGAVGAALFKAVDLWLLLLKIRPGMTLAGGVLLVAMGLVLLRVVPLPGFVSRAAAAPVSLLSGRFHFLFQSESALPKIGLGMAAGLLPCCLSWAMVLSAASTLDPGQGFLSMAFFGLGTVPALFLVGFSSSYLSARVRLLGEKAAAVSVIVMGLLLLQRGVEILA